MQEHLTGEELLARAAKLLTSDEPQEIEEGKRIAEFLLDNDTDNFGLLFYVGTGYMRQRRYSMAEHLLRHCAAMAKDADKDFAEVWNNLGFVMQNQGRQDKAREYFLKALEMKPDNGAFHNNVATMYVNAGQPHTAIEWCDKALALDPECEDAHWNRALANLELGRWEEGWSEYRNGSKLMGVQKRKDRDYHEGGTPYWDGSEGKTVVVFGEQGVGDEILGASMLEDAAKRANIIYEAHPRLVNIMRASFGDKFPIYGTRKQRELAWPSWHKIDAKVPILGLGEYFRRSDDAFPRKPYLKPDPAAVERACKRLTELGRKPKIGISWKGGSLLTRFDLRSIPLPQWRPIFDAIDADWISLQYRPQDEHSGPIINRFKEEAPPNVHHWPEVIDDLDECYAGLIHAVDLVITVNNSLVHACGAFGVPCWVMTPRACAWRYNVPGAVSCGDDRMIWYGDHVQQFRQTEDADGKWDDVIRRVALSLRDWAAREAA